MNQRNLTYKEKLVIEVFENLREGYGKLAQQNILSNALGWADIIEQMTEEEIKKPLEQGVTIDA
jgi:hypothetical protein